ncbi:hypothetical protein K7X08_009157 [Anisodus acutangulus]|uniref:Uncharacterized protein n=1 Tax=Anisodus acutangulus TaxID=402998 RepID=A0A9Q1RTU5_9SOLA|nr:hypothetical protein K7X08_009157 [Anisodus acutangulus]
MEGYTKINGTNITSKKSRSKDFSDLQSFSPPHKTNENLSPNHTIFHDIIDLDSVTKNQKTKNEETHDENENENENEKENEEKMKGNKNNNIPSGVKLSRACSVSSAKRLRLERQGSTTTTSSFQSVKRVFSMRRSSSVSEKYCRIHDQGFTISSPVLDDVAEAHEGIEKKKKKKKNGSGRILKACKRLFGI